MRGSSQGHVRAWWLGELEKKFHFYLAVKHETTEALRTQGDTSQEATASGEWAGLVEVFRWILRFFLTCPQRPTAPRWRLRVLQSVNFLTHQSTSQGKRRSYRKLWEQGWRGRKKGNDLKIHHPNYARIMNSYKRMVHIVFICLNSAFRKEVLSLWQRLNERVWKSRYF